MKNVGVLISRDFNSRVKSGSFIITTIIGVIVIIGLAFAPTLMDWMENRFTQTEVNLLLLDETHVVTPFLMDVINEQQDNQELNTTNVTGLSREEAITKMTEDGQTGILIINHTPDGQLLFTLETTNAANVMQNSVIQGIANQVNMRYSAQVLGFSLNDIAQLTSPAVFDVKEVALTTIDAEQIDSKILSAEEYTQAMILAYFLLFMIYIALIMYGNMVATGVAEEKSSRIMEVMAATVDPMELMIGKVIGIGSLGMLQFIVWIGTGLIMTSLRNLGFSIGAVPIDTLLWFGVFFILGFLFYATLYAACGAIVSRVEEVQQSTTILMMGIIVGFFVAFSAFNNPNSNFAAVMSLIPFFSPMVMFARIILSNPPAIQIALSLGFLVLGILIGTWFAARIYRVGILMYGKRPSLKETWRYIRD